jgi:hypothetical protein
MYTHIQFSGALNKVAESSADAAPTPDLVVAVPKVVAPPAFSKAVLVPPPPPPPVPIKRPFVSTRPVQHQPVEKTSHDGYGYDGYVEKTSHDGYGYDEYVAGPLIKKLLRSADEASDGASSSSSKPWPTLVPTPPSGPPPEWLLAQQIFGEEMDVDFGDHVQ